MSSGFIHLRVHTEYSLANGIVRVKPLVEACAAAGMPAVAVTDQGNLFAMVKFYKAALAAGVKPIIGVELRLRSEADSAHSSRLVLLCQDRVGYLNLTRLISRSYIEGQERGVPTVRREWLRGASAGAASNRSRKSAKAAASAYCSLPSSVTTCARAPMRFEISRSRSMLKPSASRSALVRLP